MNTVLLGPAVATALTVYGIETQQALHHLQEYLERVATALTVYGIETHYQLHRYQI